MHHEWINTEYVHSVVVNKKYLTRIRELIIIVPWEKCLAKPRQLSILRTSLDIFDTQQH